MTQSLNDPIFPAESLLTNHQRTAREKRNADRRGVMPVAYPPQRVDENQPALSTCSFAQEIEHGARRPCRIPAGSQQFESGFRKRGADDRLSVAGRRSSAEGI